ncbi:hypothetical protein QFC20_007783 [Naganishia adeliensis]|uniref:Uncharacterized protein n=1 Tax=Naganishia adeliensis TaxID=92952 RepID=A0ACC2UW55_9TREE|nr:hypothetical protein QFC20_007783 [Naganishia adeliensis]
MLTPSRQRLNEFLALAKAAYVQEQWTTITVKMIDETDESGEWREVSTKRKRALESVVTEAGVKEKLKRDMAEFLQGEEWYRDRGIPWPRGILLHGVPGSGKTSLIHGLASTCGLDIYVVSLTTQGGYIGTKASNRLTDAMLSGSMTAIPAGSVVVFEDIDVAMVNSAKVLNRDDNNPTKGLKETEKEDSNTNKNGGGAAAGSSITLSGLLNAIPATTPSGEPLIHLTIRNDKAKLDPALIRPGRFDVTIEFRNADKTICREIFKAFYPVTGKFPVVSDHPDEHPPSGPEFNVERPTVQPALFVNHLAEEFAALVPEGEFSSAEIQGK